MAVSLLPTAEAPFGFLEPIHQYILRNATPLTKTNWPMLFFLPLAPLGLVTYLIQFEDNRRYRLPLSIVGIAMMIHAASHYRFDGEFEQSQERLHTCSFRHKACCRMKTTADIRPRVQRFQQWNWDRCDALDGKISGVRIVKRSYK